MASIRITCPGCAATYAVPEAQARPGRIVRCAGCAREWLPFDAPPPEAESGEMSAVAAPPDASRSIAASLQLHAEVAGAGLEDRPSAPKLSDEFDFGDAELPQFDLPPAAPPNVAAAPPPSPPVTQAGWRAAWAASVLLLAMAGAGGVHWRAPIMLGWPPSTRLYAAFGSAHMPRAATAEMVAPRAASAISSKPSKISPAGVSE